MSIAILKEGTKYWGESEMDGGMDYVILKSDEQLTKDDLIDFFDECGIDYIGWSAPYAGASFKKRACFAIYGKKAVVTQMFGWDI